MNADILLTGAGGQLGWEVARRVQAPLTVRAMSHAQLDITDREKVLATVAAVVPRVVVNAAAYTAVDDAEANASAAYAVNRDGPAYLAEACARHDLPLIHVSTDYVFDGSKTAPYTEDDSTAPLGVYGESKRGGELVVREGCARHVILRTAWVHGVHGRNFVKTILRLGREQDVLRIVDDQYGGPTFAGDLANAVIAVARRMVDGTSPSNGIGTFHCTGSGVTTWCGLARRVFDIIAPKIGKMPEIAAITTAEYPTRARRPVNSLLDCGKLARTYGVVLRPWEEALAEMLVETLDTDISAGAS